MKWKIMQEFPDYAVSDAGLVMRVAGGRGTYPGRLLKLRRSEQGYLRVAFRKNKIQVLGSVHRLVLTAFVGKSPDGMECNHENGVKSDNRLENLKWVTPKQNMQHAIRTGLFNGWDKKNRLGENNPQAKLTTEQVKQIRHLLLQKGYTLKRLAIIFNVSATLIAVIKHRKRWTHI